MGFSGRGWGGRLAATGILVPPFNVRLARTAPKTGKGSRGRRLRAQPGRIAVRAPHALSRRCVIKVRYVPTTGNGRKLAART